MLDVLFRAYLRIQQQQQRIWCSYMYKEEPAWFVLERHLANDV